MSEIMTVAEVAEYLKTSPDTVRSLAARGELRGFRLAARGAWRFDREDVDAFVEFRKSMQAGPRTGAGSRGVGPFGQTSRSAAIAAGKRIRDFRG
ncbi:excisionase family DNA binding protein [Xylanimonas ulmi]|uniref:Excisionase family DNA binding protein n=2 Tax=Xylanimonas ulmi TaxID=228973 RepID=A0A4Q7LZN4_9MICO|nr:excisionase family DNA binding protein [Xylanibacterium ulmi]